LPLEVEFISKSENVVHFFANFATILVLQETRKILIWGVPVHPAGRSRGFEGILGGNIRFPSIQFYPQRPALYPNGACVLIFCKKKAGIIPRNTIFFDLSAKPASRGSTELGRSEYTPPCTFRSIITASGGYRELPDQNFAGLLQTGISCKPVFVVYVVMLEVIFASDEKSKNRPRRRGKYH